MTGPLARYDLGTSPLLSPQVVLETPDMARVRALDRRENMPEAQVVAMSQALCTDPTQRLRMHQAVALRELYEVGGLVAPIRVGGGKSLIILLATYLLDAKSVVLVTQAPLIREMRLEYAKMEALGWLVRLPHMISYAKLGRKDAEHELTERLRPDVLIFDEAHKLKNLKGASSVRRVARAIKQLRPKVAMLSGSMVGDKLMDYWHLICWSLGQKAPVPLTHAEAETWAGALDESVDAFSRVDLGALASLPDGFHAHMRSRRGFVPTIGGDCPAQILCSHWRPELPDELQDLIERVDATGMRPDGELLEDLERADCMVQLSQGFWYDWDPQPPDSWLDPRRACAKYIRTIIELHLDGFDSPLMVITALDQIAHGTGGLGPWTEYKIKPEYQALDDSTDEDLPDACYHKIEHPAEQPGQYAGPHLPDAQIGIALLKAWRDVRDTFAPNTVARWISDEPLMQLVAAAPEGTLIWTRHSAAGRKLQELGVPYFGGGTDPRSHAGKTCAVSIAAHGTGKNLQGWNKNVCLTTPSNPNTLEQLMGRTHRPGQENDTVSFAFATPTEYQQNSLSRVRSRAAVAGEAAGIEHKITRGHWS